MRSEQEVLGDLYEETMVGHAAEVRALTEEGIALGLDPNRLLFDALIPALEEVGARFEGDTQEGGIGYFRVSHGR